MPHLFSNTPFSAYVEARRQELASEVSGMDADRLLNTNVEDLVRYFTEKYFMRPYAL